MALALFPRYIKTWHLYIIAVGMTLCIAAQISMLNSLSYQAQALEEESFILSHEHETKEPITVINSLPFEKDEKRERDLSKTIVNSSDQHDDDKAASGKHLRFEDDIDIKPETNSKDTEVEKTDATQVEDPDKDHGHTKEEEHTNTKGREVQIAMNLLIQAKTPNVDSSTLPLDADILELYSTNKPVILGKETCAAYRNEVPPHKRIVAPAGLFNTGTNLVYELLKRNCVQSSTRRDRDKRDRDRGPRFIEDGVAWGKHIPPWWRDVWVMTPTRGSAKNKNQRVEIREQLPLPPNIEKNMTSLRLSALDTEKEYLKHRRQLRTKLHPESHIREDKPPRHDDRFHDAKYPKRPHSKSKLDYPFVNKDLVFPVVTVKDPYTWMQSMCRHPYSLTWMRDEKHCPNLVPNELDVEHGFASSIHDYPGGIPVQVNYRSDFGFSYHNSMAHLWNDWYRGYVDKDQFTFPRLIIRFEDLVFNPIPVIEEVCECVGGSMDHRDFQFLKKSAKGESGYNTGSSSLLGAVKRYGSKTLRVEKFEERDIEFGEKYLAKDLMELFGYKDPSSYEL